MARARPHRSGFGNLPVIGMFVYTVATTLLVMGDGMDFFQEGNRGDTMPALQILGSLMLLAGSLIYFHWGSRGSD